jgi:hypothetical protein
MPKGGKRVGAGRPKGSTITKTAALLGRLAKDGITPLEFILTTMRNENQPPAVRLNCAIAAAPYVHPRLANIQQIVNNNSEVLGRLFSQIKAEQTPARQLLEIH